LLRSIDAFRSCPEAEHVDHARGLPLAVVGVQLLCEPGWCRLMLAVKNEECWLYHVKVRSDRSEEIWLELKCEGRRHTEPNSGNVDNVYCAKTMCCDSIHVELKF
jgi:hypothetical protein